MLPGSGGRKGDECVSTGPGRWQVSARGGLSHQPGLVLAPSTPPKACCGLSLHTTTTQERLAQVLARGAAREVGLRGRSVLEMGWEGMAGVTHWGLDGAGGL